MTTLEIQNRYSDILMLVAKEQGFNTAEQINDNFEGLMAYILALEERFLKNMLLKANNKETMNLISIRIFKKMEDK